MKKQILKAAVMAAAITGLGLADSHVPGKGAMAVTIPFQFSAGEKTLPAGDYVIEQEADKLRICEDGIRCATVESASIDLPGLSRSASLVFQNSGGHWTLVQVWTGATAGHRVVADSEGGLNWKNSEFNEIKAKPLCVHRIAGLPASWH